MATPLGYCIQFRPYAGKEGGLNNYMDAGLGLGGVVVASLPQVLPKIADSNYHVVTDNLSMLSFITQISERMGKVNAPRKFTVDLDKSQGGTSDVVVGKLFITLVFL